jgi:hypothetical protein
MIVDVLCCLRGAREDGVILNTELTGCKDASRGIFGGWGEERHLTSLLLMAAHVASRGFELNFPSGLQHEMVGVEEPEKERHTVYPPARSFRIDLLFPAAARR